jgi:hypothetical protein
MLLLVHPTFCSGGTVSPAEHSPNNWYEHVVEFVSNVGISSMESTTVHSSIQEGRVGKPFDMWSAPRKPTDDDIDSMLDNANRFFDCNIEQQISQRIQRRAQGGTTAPTPAVATSTPPLSPIAPAQVVAPKLVDLQLLHSLDAILNMPRHVVCDMLALLATDAVAKGSSVFVLIQLCIAQASPTESKRSAALSAIVAASFTNELDECRNVANAVKSFKASSAVDALDADAVCIVLLLFLTVDVSFVQSASY